MTESPQASDEPQAPDGTWPSWAWGALVAAAVVGLVISNLFLVLQMNDANDEIAALRESIQGVDSRVNVLSLEAGAAADDARTALGALDPLASRLAAVEALPVATTEAVESTAPPVTANVVGLPLFAGDPTDDPAVGILIASVGGSEYYTSLETTYDLTDGRSRAILVWAHWCPFCQEELPVVSEWLAANGDSHELLEIISITTAIDDERPNPLIPYLEANEFGFPVLLDESGELSAQLGVSAFPFWVFLGPDGTVLGRLAGANPIETLSEIFGQLQEIAAAG